MSDTLGWLWKADKRRKQQFPPNDGVLPPWLCRASVITVKTHNMPQIELIRCDILDRPLVFRVLCVRVLWVKGKKKKKKKKNWIQFDQWQAEGRSVINFKAA